jgi:Icc-related predicted phosphoesterase
MRLIAIADDDCKVGNLDHTAPVLLSLGDMLDATILRAAAQYQAEVLLAVRGNHDSNAPFDRPIVDLHGLVYEVDGVTFGGFAGSWRYKPGGHHLYDQREVERALRHFPEVDVFIAHNSPRGIHERDHDVHQGFDAFMDYIDRAAPRYFIHGHQHVNKRTQLNQTEIIAVLGEVVLDLSL